jgi:hypothetical protein
MNQLVERASTNTIGISDTGAGMQITPQSLAEVVRFAEVMAKGGIALPKHCRDQPGVCMAICIQALKWEMDPFSVANKSYSVNDRLAYEAQLIAAVVHTRAGIRGRPEYEFRGSGPDLTCVVRATLKDGSVREYVSPRIADIKVKNSPLWQTDPQQQLGYYSVRSWARRFVPEVLLGIYDREEIEGIGPDNARDVTPSMAERYAPKQTIIDSGAVSSRQPEQGGVSPASPDSSEEPAATGDLLETSVAPAEPATDQGASALTPADAPALEFTPAEHEALRLYWGTMASALGAGGEVAEIQKAVKRASDVFKLEGFKDCRPEAVATAAAIFKAVLTAVNGQSTIEEAMQPFAFLVDAE